LGTLRYFLLLPLCLQVTGCANTDAGPTQHILVSTNPAGALCTLTRDGKTLGSVAETPGSIEISKSQSLLMITCSKPGFETAIYIDRGELDQTSVGNMIFRGSGLGQMVDAAGDKGRKYTKAPVIDLVPESAKPSE